MNRLQNAIGARLAHFLQKQRSDYFAFSTISPDRLRATLRPGDVLLVEGNSRISSAIKYLTRSTWSHSAMYMGGPDEVLIEADLEQGVRAVQLATYCALNLRICRPVGLRDSDLNTVLDFMRASIGRRYDLKNVIDLARYLLPQPPVPHHWRRRMIALGSGDPTRAICSTLIAEAFGKVGYPILPEITLDQSRTERREILHIRHYSLYTPRDFDLSPYFQIIKPTIEAGFDYKTIRWRARGHPPPHTPVS